MTKRKECFFLETTGTKQIRKGVFWLLENSKASFGGWIAGNSIQVLENASDHSGLEALKELLTSENHIAMLSGIAVKAVTEEIIPANGENKPLLGLSPTENYLNQLDEIPNISKMMVAPHGADEVDEWAKRNNANYYYDIGELQSRKIIELDSVVKVALGELTDYINSHREKTGYRHPVTHSFHVIVSTLYMLAQNGYDIDPTAIGNCLVKDYGWGPVSAKLVDEVADEMRSGQKQYLKSELSFWNNDIIDKWRARVG